MKARGRWLWFFCALALLVLPTSAAAKPGYYVIEPSRVVVVDSPDSGGYSITVVGVNTKSVEITVSEFSSQKTATSYSSATYAVRGRVTGDRVEGRFGSRGRVSVRFKPTEPPKAVAASSGCKGKPSTSQNGRFTGTIRFQGEGGFARADVSTAAGFVIRSPRLVCKRPSGEVDRRLFKTPRRSASARSEAATPMPPGSRSSRKNSAAPSSTKTPSTTSAPPKRSRG